jgi:hypothetical protein
MRTIASRFCRTARSGKKVFGGVGLARDRGSIAHAIRKPTRLAIAATRKAVRHPHRMPARPNRKERAVPTVKELV